jgi:hypothetical protein
VRSCMEPLIANACGCVVVATHAPDTNLAVSSHHKTADDLVERPPTSSLLGAVASFR